MLIYNVVSSELLGISLKDKKGVSPQGQCIIGRTDARKREKDRLQSDHDTW